MVLVFNAWRARLVSYMIVDPDSRPYISTRPLEYSTLILWSKSALIKRHGWPKHELLQTSLPLSNQSSLPSSSQFQLHNAVNAAAIRDF